MIKVTECGKKGCTVQFSGNAYVVAQQYAALTLHIVDECPDILKVAQHLIEETLYNGKTDKCND